MAWQGYKDVMQNCRDNATVLREGIQSMGYFDVVSKDSGVPLVAFSLRDTSRYTVFEVAESLRRFGWIVPAYTMPPDAQHVTVLRVVIREDFSRTLAERLVLDIEKVLHELDGLPARAPSGDLAALAAAEASQRDKDKQREVISLWKRAVLAKKKTNGVC